MIGLVLSLSDIRGSVPFFLVGPRMMLESKARVLLTRTPDDGCRLTLLILPNSSGAVTKQLLSCRMVTGASRKQIDQSKINLFLAEYKANKETWL